MKQVFAKIAKIGEEVRAADPMKVQFAAIDDLESAVNETKSINSDFDKLTGQRNEFVKVAQGLVGDYNRISGLASQNLKAAQATLQKITKLQREIAAQSKELGVNVKTIPAYNKSQSQAALLEVRINYLKNELEQELKSSLPNL
jgi:hypothetical protein